MNVEGFLTKQTLRVESSFYNKILIVQMNVDDGDMCVKSYCAHCVDKESIYEKNTRAVDNTQCYDNTLAMFIREFYAGFLR